MKFRPSLTRAGVVAGTAALVVALSGAALVVLPHWDYADQADWGTLGGKDAPYAACTDVDGSAQSPINIRKSRTVGKDLKNIRMNWSESTASVDNNGHTVQLTAGEGAGSITIRGKQFTLLQAHFHAVSEHKVNGMHYPLEMHFVSAASDGTLAVIGVFVREGDEDNRAWAPVVKAVRAETDPAADPVKAKIDWAALLPASQRTFRYVGSLTTPPCTEGVRWNVMIAPVTLSAEQIEVFHNAYDDNHRYVQPRHGRTVLRDTSAN